MRILVTGRGKSGSWKIRGEQLGAAIGATVIPNYGNASDFDLGVLVKRPIPMHGAPVVWDVLDSWLQPEGNLWDRDACISWLRGQVRQIKPHAIVAATQVMAEDCSEFGLPVLALPHHARPGQAVNPIREKVHTVGYEGAEAYLGGWRHLLEQECRSRGWSFVVNPMSLSSLDIVVALRDSPGYAARNWKSNVKLANAQSTGTPCIVGDEAGYRETAGGGERWASDSSQLKSALDELENYGVRREVTSKLTDATPYLENVAQQYREWLYQLS